MQSNNYIDHKVTWSQQITYSLLLTSLVLIVKGYVFPSGNHGQEIPPILAILNPELYRNDFAVQSYLAPGVRYYYQHLIAFLVSDAKLSLATVYFSLFLISLFSFVFAIQKIAIHVATAARANNRGLLYLAGGILVFWSLISLNSWGTGSGGIFRPLALPAVFAMGVAAWGIYGAIRKRWILAYGLFGLAALLQFLVGFLPGLVVFFAFLTDIVRNQRWKTGFNAIMLWGIGLAIVYVPMALHATPAPADFNFLQSFGLYRVPHHWSPSTGSVTNWGSDILLAVGALVLSWRFYKDECEQVKWLAMLSASGIAIAMFAVVLNYLFVDVWQITIIGKLQFQRIIPFAHFLIFILLLFATIRSLQDSRAPAALALIFAPLTKGFGLVVTTFSLSYFGKISLFRQTVLLLLAFGAFPFLVFIVTFGRSGTFGLVTTGSSAIINIAFLIAISLYAALMSINNGMLRRPFVFFGLIISLSVSVTLLSPNVQTYILRLVSVGNLEPKLHNFVQQRWAFDRTGDLPGLVLANALATESGKDDVVLLPPSGEIFTETFQLASRRAAFFVHKNVPYDDYHVWMWAERSKSLLGIDRLKPFMSNKERASLFKERPSVDIERLARQNRVCFLVSRQDWHDFNGKIIARETIGDNTWELWKLEACKS